MLADMGGELAGVKFAPAAPGGLGGEGVGFLGGKVAIDGTLPQPRTAGRPRHACRLPEQTSPAVHANPTHKPSCPKPTNYTANVNVKYYSH